MKLPTVSVVVVSRERPDSLQRTLTGISQLRYPHFEIVVVADKAGHDAVASGPLSGRLKLQLCEDANISVARNIGIALAAGEIVAFIDDDAVPETGWLHHLIAPFATADVAAAGGFVRGRNGISFQWQAQSVDGTGTHVPLAMTGDTPVVLHPQAGRAIKTEGTNMAVRRDLLADMGGFDPAFRFFKDETDLNLRLAEMNLATAIVPLAEVHHGYFASARRTAARVPRDLFEIGASTGVFLRKHCAEDDRASVWKAVQADRRRALVAHMVRGDLLPGDVGRLMRGLRKGYAEGQSRAIAALPTIPRAAEGFRQFETPDSPAKIITGRRWRQRAIQEQAQASLKRGERPSVFVFSRTALFHRVTFHKAGYWEQSGGLFGRSTRSQPLFRLIGFRARVTEEIQRVASQRLLRDVGGKSDERLQG